MYFHIKEIVLWSRSSTIPPHRVPFAGNALNVVSGVSRTGKSAVIPIIDYCLGSDTCQIPVNTIRDRCSWFGLIAETARGQILLARREPGSQRTTGDMYVVNAPSVEPPHTIQAKNTNVDAVKRALDGLAGLTQLDFDVDDAGGGFKGRPSFRDLMAFTFQPQNIVANQSVLFFKADTHEHREKLRTVFPYVLGAISPSLLATQHQLGQLRRELSRKERELASLRQVSDRWIAEIRAWTSQGRELGVVPATLPADLPVPALLDALRDATRRGGTAAVATVEAIDGAIAELVGLQREEADRSTALAQLRRRLSEMVQLRDATTTYRNQLYVQRDRLRVAEWLEELHRESHACPICGQDFATSPDHLTQLIEALGALEKTASQAAGVPVAFDRELQRVGDELRRATEQLEGVRHRIRALTRASDAAKARQDGTLQSARFIGRLEQALEHYEQLGSDAGVSAEVETLREQVRQLEAVLREQDIAKRTNLALKRLASLVQPLLPKLDAERPEDPVSFSIPDLTLRIAGRDREDYLWEIGSGSNWLSYHLSLAVGLHMYFLQLPQSPVPSFLIVDQPSQVYFPKQLSAAQRAGDQEPYLDEDVAAVRKIFAMLADAVRDSKGELQIIVLDHATDTVWGDVDGLAVAAQWRDGVKLVPDDWPSVVT
jgi:hypothetical protein